MSRSSFAPRRAALWLAALAVVGACTAGVDRMVGPRTVTEAPSFAVLPGSPYAGLVISQVYGGGGNSGATFRNDFIELYNSSGNPIALSGLSVQYASAAGTSWQTTALTSITLAPGQYYLVQEAAGSGGTVSLPTPDATGAIAMSATNGKVALVVGTGALSGSGCPIGTNIIDFVGFGTANCFEGTAATGALTNSLAAIRADSGRTDTNQNGSDFIVDRVPNPRNTAAPLVPPKSLLSVTIAPANPLVQLGGSISFTAAASRNNAQVAITSASWTSSNISVATIDPSTGVVTTVGLGTTSIRVNAVTSEGDVSASTTLTVAAEPARVNVSPSTWVLFPSNPTRAFSATALDAGGTPTSTVFTWSSSDPSIMTVDASGGVTGKTYGTALIIATSANGIADTAVVHVSNMRVQARLDSQNQPLPLPVGFQTQLFLTGTNVDRNGNPVGNGDVVWSSRNPDVVSVNPTTGVVTAKSPGTAIITATAKSDGVSAASAEIVANVATLAPNARVGHNTELGIPTDADASDDVIIARRQYTLSYNPARRGPNWVSWNLDPSHEGSVTRCNCFTADTALTRLGLPALDTQDWVNGGVWSRGHLSPSADWQVTDGDNAPTFFLTNMLPQNQTMNGGAWGDLENRLRVISIGSTEIYIMAGGIFTKDRSGPGVDGFGVTSGTGRIAVPDSMWKVAVIVPDGRAASQIGASDVQVIAVKMPNDATAGGSYDRYLTTIDAIQQSTGYDLLSALPENVQCAIESRNCAPTARISGAGLAGGDEGETLSFSALTSSDPDGDALSYQWEVDGAGAGTGSTLGYTFADDGSYSVRLIVSDGRGGADTARATVAVRNVAPTVSAFSGATILSGERYASTGSFADPGADRWSASVDYGDGEGATALTLAGVAFRLAHDYPRAGTYTVTVRVTDDDGGIGTSTARVVVQTPLQGVSNLSDMLGSLGLGNGELSSLRAKLNAASAALRRDDATPAVNTLEAFTNEIDAMVRSGRLGESAAAPVLEYARRVIASASA